MGENYKSFILIKKSLTDGIVDYKEYQSIIEDSALFNVVKTWMGFFWVYLFGNPYTVKVSAYGHSQYEALEEDVSFISVQITNFIKSIDKSKTTAKEIKAKIAEIVNTKFNSVEDYLIKKAITEGTITTCYQAHADIHKNVIKHKRNISHGRLLRSYDSYDIGDYWYDVLLYDCILDIGCGFDIFPVDYDLFYEEEFIGEDSMDTTVGVDIEDVEEPYTDSFEQPPETIQTFPESSNPSLFEAPTYEPDPSIDHAPEPEPEPVRTYSSESSSYESSDSGYDSTDSGGDCGSDD